MDNSKKLSTDKKEIISILSADYGLPFSEVESDVNFIEQQLQLYKHEHENLSNARKSNTYVEGVNRFGQVHVYNEIVRYLDKVGKKNKDYANQLDNLFKREAERYQIPYGM